MSSRRRGAEAAAPRPEVRTGHAPRVVRSLSGHGALVFALTLSCEPSGVQPTAANSGGNIRLDASTAASPGGGSSGGGNSGTAPPVPSRDLGGEAAAAGSASDAEPPDEEFVREGWEPRVSLDVARQNRHRWIDLVEQLGEILCRNAARCCAQWGIATVPTSCDQSAYQLVSPSAADLATYEHTQYIFNTIHAAQCLALAQALADNLAQSCAVDLQLRAQLENACRAVLQSARAPGAPDHPVQCQGNALVGTTSTPCFAFRGLPLAGCVGNVCVQAVTVALGESCNSRGLNEESFAPRICPDGAYCDLSESAPTCKPVVAVGAPCTHDLGCNGGAQCGQGVCIALPGVGERCPRGDFCQLDSVCEYETLTCRPIGSARLGEPCSRSSDCAALRNGPNHGTIRVRHAFCELGVCGGAELRKLFCSF